MPTNISCPSCQALLNLPDEILGKKAKCPTCLSVFQAPGPIPVAKPIDQIPVVPPVTSPESPDVELVPELVPEIVPEPVPSGGSGFDWQQVPKQRPCPDFWHPQLWISPLKGARLLFWSNVLSLIAIVFGIVAGVSELESTSILWTVRVLYACSGILALIGLFFICTVPEETNAQSLFTGTLVFALVIVGCFGVGVGLVLPELDKLPDNPTPREVEELREDLLAMDELLLLIVVILVAGLVWIVLYLLAFRRLAESLRDEQLAGQFLMYLFMIFVVPIVTGVLTGLMLFDAPGLFVILTGLIELGMQFWMVSLLHWTQRTIERANAKHINARLQG